MFFSGQCETNILEWNYYLVSQDGEVFYESYKNQKISKEGNIWRSGLLLPWIFNNHQVLTMNISESLKKYPIGQFYGHLSEDTG